MVQNVFSDVASAAADDASDLVPWVRSAQKIVVLSGAGMSAESGVPTFRDAHTGFWQHYDVEQLATADAWWANPQLVYSWYLWRARMVRSVAPNAGHEALARWGAAADVFISTQNVDDLHERAGSAAVTHLHGSLYAFRCDECAQPAQLSSDVFSGVADPGTDEDLVMVEPPECNHCQPGRIRPDIVFFGEFLPQQAWQQTEQALTQADLVLVVGTSGVVQPAASLPFIASSLGTPVVEINPVASELTPFMDLSIAAGAAVALPQLLHLR